MKNNNNITKACSQTIIACMFTLTAAATTTDNSISLKTNTSATTTTVNDNQYNSSEGVITYSTEFSATTQKGITYIKKTGDHDWSYILQDSTGEVIAYRNNINETDSISRLENGVYNVFEVNPYGLGTMQTITISNSSVNKTKESLNANVNKQVKIIYLFDNQEKDLIKSQPTDNSFPTMKMKTELNEGSINENLM